MFKITNTATFTHPVVVLVPTDGGHDKHTFKATFRVVPTDEAAAHDLNTAEGSAAFLRVALVGLDEVVDDNGQPVPFSNALRDQLLNVPFVRAALGRTYFAAITKAAAGN